jgi:hypothetical protein
MSLLSLPVLLTLTVGVAQAGTPRASSELKNDKGHYSAQKAFDGLLATSWAEGDRGSGKDAWLELDLLRSTEVKSVSIWPGDLSRGKKSLRETARPGRVQVYMDGKPVGDEVRIDDGVRRVDIPVGVTGRKVRVVVVQSEEGFVFQDLHIAEMAINYIEDDTNTRSRLLAWLESSTGQRAKDAWKEEIDAAYAACKASDFGDRDSFAFLSDAVGDGAQFLRPMVQRYVSEGFRAQALKSSKRAQKAVRLLKDPNAVPSLELATTRSKGDDAVFMGEQVEIFEAYANLIGGKNFNVGYWGEPGFVLGGLQSFGEPLNLESNRDGRVYIADLGNNRIQLFDETGKPVRQWGPAADITNRYFSKTRTWYASGAAAGEESGQWVTPVDVDIIPEKETDGFVGIDALGRVQVFDGEGRRLISWTVETRRTPRPGVGGEAYVSWNAKTKSILTIMEDEAVIYTLDSEEIARWDVEDGTPNAVEVMKDGKLLMAFGRDIIMYNMDGFRYGTVIRYDQLDDGFEDMDITLDEEDRIWVLTDTGYVHKFKSIKKKEWSLKVIDRPLTHPRMAVHEGIVFIVSDDQIERIDAYQLKIDKAAADAEAKARSADGNSE